MSVLLPCMLIIKHAFLVLWRSERGGWLDLPELELRIAVSHCVAAGNRTVVLCKSTLLAAEPPLQPQLQITVPDLLVYLSSATIFCLYFFRTRQNLS